MFGLHRFKSASNAFKAIEGGYGSQFEGLDQDEMYILTDYEFQRVVFERLCYLALAKKTGEPIINYDCLDVDKAYKYAMPTDENGMGFNNYFTDFNYFLASNRNCCFYTSFMTFKDDGVTDFNEEQWDIASELIDSYDFVFIWEQAKRIVEFNDEIESLNSLNNYLVDNELCPFQMSDYDDLTEQLTDIFNNEIKDELNEQ